MKTYPYNRTSSEGRRLHRLLDARFNKGSLEQTNPKTFDSYEVPAVTQCRVNKIGFLFASNLSGMKRPQIRVEADVEVAWGQFSDAVTTFDFTHDRQELPLTYVQPLQDDTLKHLIDAGLYRDDDFEPVMNKLMENEMFDAEANMTVTHMEVDAENDPKKKVPVFLVDPVTVVHDEYDPSEQTTIANLVKRSALLAIEFKKEGFKSEALLGTPEQEQDQEIFLSDEFTDAVAQKEEEMAAHGEQSFVASSELLDQEIDLTDRLKDSMSFDHTSDDDRIRELKERERYEAAKGASIDSSLLDKRAVTEQTVDAEDLLDSSLFDGDLGYIEIDTEDDGPSL